VEVDWFGYELHPETPPGGVPISELLPDPERMHAHVRAFAAGFGIADLAPPDWLPSTRRAHAVARHAQARGHLEAFRAAAFDAYWRAGKGLESDSDLAAIARSAGLEPAAAVAAAADEALLAQVDEAHRVARTAGVTGVPTFDIGEVRIVGCQRYDVLADAVRRIAARRRG
jgi:predicted DsbA family dithiol-disulfide isomerase